MPKSQMPKRKVDTHCFAPGCHSGYPGARSASLFGAPRDEELRKKWQQNLRRQDKPLSESSAVCELHFEPHLVLRDYVHVINGTEVRIPRGKPSLAPGAIPTLLLGCTGHPPISSATKRKSGRKRSPATSASPESQQAGRCRNIPNRDERALPENGAADEPFERFTTVHSRSEPSDSQPCTAVCEPLERFTIGSVDELPLPSRRWGRLQTDGYRGAIFATTAVRKEERLEIIHEKAVCFNAVEDKVFAQVFVRGVMCSDGIVRSLTEAGDVLREAENACICKGAATKSEFIELEQSLTPELRCATAACGQSVFSTTCEGKVATEGAVCVECKAVRKALLTGKSRGKRLNAPEKAAFAVRLKPEKRNAARPRDCTAVVKKGRAANGVQRQKDRCKDRVLSSKALRAWNAELSGS